MKVMNCDATVIETVNKVFCEIPSIQFAHDDISFDFSNEVQEHIFGQEQSQHGKEFGRLFFVDAKNSVGSFHRIPQVIILQNEIGTLYSFVETVCTDKNTYYVAYIRRSNQLWYTE